MTLIYSFTLALFLTIVLIPFLIRFSAQFNLVDDPGADRKIHDTVMPRSGGLAIILGVFLPLAFLLPMDGYVPYLIAGCIIIIGFGLLDDKVELNYIWKLFGQSLAIIVVMFGGIVAYELPLFGLGDAPVWASYPLTFFFLLGVINGVNFSDGLDGLAAGMSLLALATIAVFAVITDNHTATLLALTVMGGILGFLRYNTFPARIFMGDSGSQFLGFITACLAIIVTQAETSALNTFLPVLLLGLPILDIVQVVPVRIKKKLPLPGPDKEHFHHQLVKLAFGHHEVVAIIYVLQLVMMGGALWLRFESDLALIVFYSAYLVSVLGTLYWANIVGWKARDVAPGQQRDRRSRFFHSLTWIHLFGPLVILVLLGSFFIAIPLLLEGMGAQFSVVALALAVVLTTLSFLYRSAFALWARVSSYSVSVFIVYLLGTQGAYGIQGYIIDGFLLCFAIFLALAIRTSRKEHFRLDTQDLLILAMVIIVPLLPIDALDEFAVGQIALRLAVLMYGCEFLLARGERNKLKLLNTGAVTGLLVLGLSFF